MTSRAPIIAGKTVILLEVKDSIDTTLGLARKKLKSFSASIGNLGADLFRGGLVGTLGVGAAVRQFQTFEDALLFLETKSQGTREEFQNLEVLIRSLGRTTSFTAQEVADGAAVLAQAGLKTNEVVNTLQPLLDLARGEKDLGLEQAGAILANTLRSFSLDASRATEVASQFVRASRLGTVSVLDLKESLKEVLGTLRTLNVDLPTALALITQLAERSLKGTKAGTSLNTALLQLASKKDVIRDALNIQLPDNINGDQFIVFLDKLYDRLNKLGNLQRTAILQSIFNIRGGRAITALDDIKKILDLQKAIRAAGNEARQTAKKIDSGLGGSLRRATAAARDFGITVGNIASGPLKTFLEIIPPISDRLTELATAFPKVTLSILALPPGILLAGAGLLTLSFTLNKLAAAIGIVGVALGAITSVGFKLLNTQIELATRGIVGLVRVSKTIDRGLAARFLPVADPERVLRAERRVAKARAALRKADLAGNIKDIQKRQKALVFAERGLKNAKASSFLGRLSQTQIPVKAPTLALLAKTEVLVLKIIDLFSNGSISVVKFFNKIVEQAKLIRRTKGYLQALSSTTAQIAKRPIFGRIPSILAIKKNISGLQAALRKNRIEIKAYNAVVRDGALAFKRNANLFNISNAFKTQGQALVKYSERISRANAKLTRANSVTRKSVFAQRRAFKDLQDDLAKNQKKINRLFAAPNTPRTIRRRQQLLAERQQLKDDFKLFAAQQKAIRDRVRIQARAARAERKIFVGLRKQIELRFERLRGRALRAQNTIFGNLQGEQRKLDKFVRSAEAALKNLRKNFFARALVLDFKGGNTSFVAVLKNLGTTVKNAFSTIPRIFDTIKTKAIGSFTKILSVVKSVPKVISSAFKSLFQSKTYIGFFSGIGKGFTNFFRLLPKGIKLFAELLKWNVKLRFGFTKLAIQAIPNLVHWMYNLIRGTGLLIRGFFSLLNVARKLFTTLSGWGLILDFVLIFGDKIEFIRKAMGRVSTGFKNAFAILGGTLKAIQPAIDLFGEGIKQILEGRGKFGLAVILQSIGSIFTITLTRMKDALREIKFAFAPVLDFFNKLFKVVGALIELLASFIGSAFSTTFKAIGDTIAGNKEGGAGLIKRVFDAIDVKALVLELATFLKGVADQISLILKGIYSLFADTALVIRRGIEAALDAIGRLLIALPEEYFGADSADAGVNLRLAANSMRISSNKLSATIDKVQADFDDLPNKFQEALQKFSDSLDKAFSTTIGSDNEQQKAANAKKEADEIRKVFNLKLLAEALSKSQGSVFPTVGQQFGPAGFLQKLQQRITDGIANGIRKAFQGTEEQNRNLLGGTGAFFQKIFDFAPKLREIFQKLPEQLRARGEAATPEEFRKVVQQEKKALQERIQAERKRREEFDNQPSRTPAERVQEEQRRAAFDEATRGQREYIRFLETAGTEGLDAAARQEEINKAEQTLNVELEKERQKRAEFNKWLEQNPLVTPDPDASLQDKLRIAGQNDAIREGVEEERKRRSEALKRIKGEKEALADLKKSDRFAKLAKRGIFAFDRKAFKKAREEQLAKLKEDLRAGKRPQIAIGNIKGLVDAVSGDIRSTRFNRVRLSTGDIQQKQLSVLEDVSSKLGPGDAGTSWLQKIAENSGPLVFGGP